jgi:catechol 2,3-dioxygenase-like lactoylglutathione lyase family enzyme
LAPSITRILETALYVEDLDRAQDFYIELFGLELMLRDERMAALALPDRQVLLLFKSGSSQTPIPTPFGDIPPHGATGPQHLCFAIEEDQLSAWQQRLQEFAIAIESSLTWPQNATSLYFRDPDGHSLELSTPRLWPNDPG